MFLIELKDQDDGNFFEVSVIKERIPFLDNKFTLLLCRRLFDPLISPLSSFEDERDNRYVAYVSE